MATSMTNLVVRVTLPKGLSTTNGAFLDRDVSLVVIADLAPFYASIAQVRLEGGPYMAKMKDTTLAAQIFQSSKEADQKQELLPAVGSVVGNRFYPARNFWTINNTVYSLLVSISGMVGYTGGHVLANFSVTKQRGEQGTGFSAKLADLKQTMKDYQVVLESGGKVIPGGRAAFGMAAKGVFDDERAPGRTWLTTGMGSNTTSSEVPSVTGGRGKTMKFFANPIVSTQYLGNMILAQAPRRPNLMAGGGGGGWLENIGAGGGGAFSPSSPKNPNSSLPKGASLYVAQTPEVPPNGPTAPTVLLPYRSVSLMTAETISGYTVVASQNGLAVNGDASNLALMGAVLGLATGGARVGTQVNIQTEGSLVYDGWTWTSGQPIFLALAGALTQAMPSTGFLQVIGYAVNPTTILIAIQAPILLP